MKKAFTLAEVLITLGIIGIIAALTMPALVASYQKKVLETRIKHFYSVLNQATTTKIAEDGALDNSMVTVGSNANQALEYFNVNYKPYMQITEITLRDYGVAVGFPNGSGMFIKTTSRYKIPYLSFCVNYKDCKTGSVVAFSSYVDAMAGGDGKTAFSFEATARTVPMDGDRETMKSYCANAKSSPNLGMWCTRLLMLDGWEIKDDYPVQF
jgi:prepilin-type N-terminal cleavage/methylation domain-containing protein